MIGTGTFTTGFFLSGTKLCTNSSDSDDAGLSGTKGDEDLNRCPQGDKDVGVNIL